MLNAKKTTVILSVLLAVSGMALNYSRHESRKRFVEIQTQQQKHDENLIEWGRLQLEKAAWAETGTIEQRARTELAMRAPKTERILVIEQ